MLVVKRVFALGRKDGTASAARPLEKDGRAEKLINSTNPKPGRLACHAQLRTFVAKKEKANNP